MDPPTYLTSKKPKPGQGQGQYISDVHTERGGDVSIVFKQYIYCSFLWIVGLRGSQNWLFFVDVINVFTYVPTTEQLKTGGLW